MGALSKLFGGRTPLVLKRRAETRWLYESRRINAFRVGRRARQLYYTDLCRKAALPKYKWLTKGKKLLAKHTLEIPRTRATRVQAQAQLRSRLLVIILVTTARAGGRGRAEARA